VATLIKYLGILVAVFVAVLLALYSGFIVPFEGLVFMGLVNIILLSLAVWHHLRQSQK
jgi:hypothetical protein